MYKIDVTNVHVWAEEMGLKVVQVADTFFAQVSKKSDAEFFDAVNKKAAECVTVKRVFGCK